MSRERYSIGDLMVDVGAARVERRGEELRLPGLSFDLLVALTRRAPDVVGHDTLAADVWKLDSVTDETIMQRVALLRRALGDAASEPTYVRSVRGRGYTLVPEVVALSAEVPRRFPLGGVAALVAIVAAVAVLVGMVLRDEPGEASTAVTTAPLTADELAMQADEFLARHRDGDNEIAIDLYERALQLEPGHRGAMIGLSLGLSQRASKFNRSSEEARRALELADRRLAVAPDDGRAHYARAFALDSRGHVGPALESYLHAAALEPDNPVPRADAAYLQMVRGDLVDSLAANLEVLEAGERLHYLEVEIGWTLGLLGFESAAAVWLRRALDLWPDSLFAGSSFAAFRLHQGRLEEAERLAREVLDLGVERPELPTVLGDVALLRGDRAEASRRYREAVELSPGIDPGTVRLLALRQAEPGAELRYAELVAKLERDLEEGSEWPGTAVNEMLLHAAFGESDAALEALDHAIDLGYRESAWLMLDPLLGELREHPGFIERIERIALEIEDERAGLLADPRLTEAFLGSARF